jgi:hypothetical protein
MRRLPMMLASASAAALTTLAVTVAVPAIADDGPDWKSEDEFAACLRDHGLAGAPGGAALKPWLGESEERDNATTERALSACSPKPDIAQRGPSEQQLRSCLKDHGVEVPGGDARALKQWLLTHGDDAAYRDALKACDIAPLTKPGVGGGACDKEGAVATAIPARRADKVATAESDGADLHAVSGAD